MNKILTAKILTAYFVELNLERDHYRNVDQDPYTMKLLEFSNGLIIAPSQTTADTFFPSRDEIDGAGNEVLEKVEDTGNTEDWKTEELLGAYKSYWEEFGCGYEALDPCSSLVGELIREKKEVTFYFTGQCKVKLQLSEEEIAIFEQGKKDLANLDPSAVEIYDDLILKIFDLTESSSILWELKNDFLVEEIKVNMSPEEEDELDW